MNLGTFKHFIKDLMPAEKIDEFFRLVDNDEIDRILGWFSKKEDSFENEIQMKSWLQTVIRNSVSKRKADIDKKKYDNNWESVLDAQKNAWSSDLPENAERMFDQMSPDHQRFYRSVGRNHLAYAHEMVNFNWNPLIDVGTVEFAEECRRYDSHMLVVERACAILVLASQIKKGAFKVSGNVADERKQRLSDAAKLLDKIKSVKFNF